VDVLDAVVAGDQLDAPRLAAGQVAIAAADALMESQGFLFEPAFVLGGGGIAMAGAVDALLRRDVDDESEVGLQAATGEAVELADEAEVKPAAMSLVGERSIGEAVAEDDASLLQGGEK